MFSVTFRKINRSLSLRINSLNQFVQNTTDDDPSIIYGTQKNSAGPSEFRRPSPPPQRLEINRRNLNLEIQVCLESSNNDSSGIHDLGTEEISFNNPETSNQKSSEISDGFLEADTQAVSLNSKCIDSENLYTGDDIILQANTQVVSIKLNPQTENLNQDYEINDTGIFDHSTQQVSAKSDKIHEEATQALTFESPASHSNKLNKSSLRTGYSDLVKEIFEETSDSTKSDNIYEEATQTITLESPNTSKSVRFQNLNKSDTRIEDSDTNEEAVFEEVTQKVPLNRKIDEEATQAIPLESPNTSKPVRFQHLNKSDTRIEDSDTDEEGVFEKVTQKVPVNRKIDEEATQAISLESPNTSKSVRFQNLNKSDTRIEDSDTDEEGVFEEATQKIPANRKIDGEATQTISLESPNTSKSVRFQNLNKSVTRIEDSDTDEEGVFEEATQKIPANRKIYEEATQACTDKSPIEAGNLGGSSIIEDSDTDEGGIFESSTQKYTASSSKKILEEATQVFEVNVKDPILSSKVVQADSKVNDSDTDEEGIFENSTQAVSPKISGSSSNFNLKSNLKFNKTIISVEGDSNKIVEANFSKPSLKDSPKSKEFENLNIFKSESKISTSLKVDSSLNYLSTDNQGSFKEFEGQEEAQTLIKSRQKDHSNLKELEEKVEEELSSPLVEISTKADSKLPEDSETDDEGIFQKDLEEKQAIQEEKITEYTNSELESEDSKPGFKNTKIESPKSDSKIAEDSETGDENNFQEEKSNCKEIETHTEKISVSKDPEAISESFQKADSKFTAVSEAKDEESKSKDLEENKSMTTVQKEKMPESNNSICEVESSATADTKSAEDSKSETDDEGVFEAQTSKPKIFNRTRTPIQKDKSPILKNKISPKPSTSKDQNQKENHPQESEIDCEAPTQIIFPLADHEGVSQAQISKSKILNRKNQSKVPIEIEKSLVQKGKISPKLSTSEEQNQKENHSQETEIDYEGPTQIIFPLADHEGVSQAQISKPKILNRKNQSKVPIEIEKSPVQKGKISSKPSTSKEQNQKENHSQETEIDYEGPTQIIFPLADHESVSQAQISKPKILNRKNQSKASIEIEKSPVQKGKISPKPSTSKEQNRKENHSQESEIDYEAPTQIFNHEEVVQEQNSKSTTLNRKKTPIQKENPSKENEIDDQAPTQVMSSERKSFGSRNVSIEDFDYEMAPTQLLENLEVSKIKTPENKTRGSKTSGNNSNSGSKPNPVRRSTRRLNPKLHDTIEENLNEMFEGEGEEIGEPSQMLTQQLENILEESQVNEELLHTPSTSRTRAARRIESSPVKTPPSLRERSSRSKNSTQVGRFNFKVKPKPSSGLQVSVPIKSETCKLSNESDEDFVPFLPNYLSIRSNINLENCSSPAPSTSSELSIDESLLKSSPSLTNNRKGRKGRKGRKFLGRTMLEVKKSKRLNSIGNFHIPEEVEKLSRSTNHEVDSDSDAEFEELKRIADRILKTKSVYVQNRNVLISKDAKAVKNLEKMVESSSVFQVDTDNCSPRMSKLNIIRSKKERKVESPAQKNDQTEKNSKNKTQNTNPLKKRPLKMIDEESETATGERGKRLKMGDAEELEISTLLARRSIPFDNSPKVDEKAKVEEKIEEVKELKKNLNLKTEEVKGKDITSSASAVVNDSFEGPKGRRRLPKIQKVSNDEVGSSIKRKASKQTASSSFVESAEIPTSTTENLEVPSKAKKTKANTIQNEENEEDVKKNLRTRKVIKRKIDQTKEIISNSSSSSSFVDNSFNDAKNSMTEKLKKAEPKKRATRGRKKKEVSNAESMTVDNSSASSSMVSLNGTSAEGNSSASSTPTRSIRSRMASSLKHKVLFTGIPADNYQKSLSQLGKIKIFI